MTGDAAVIVESVMRDGLVRYATAVQTYWPAVGDVDAAESCMVVNLAAAFSDARFLVFGEVQVEGCPDEHIDLLALDPERKIAVAIEAKRMWRGKQREDLAADIERLTSLRLPARYDRPQGVTCYVGVVVSGWLDDSFIPWWSRHPHPPAPGSCRPHPHWDLIASFLGSSLVVDGVDATRHDGSKHSALFAIRSGPAGGFWR